MSSKDVRPKDAVLEDRDELQRTPGGVVLVPQPSDDPQDPLNWPRWRKNLTFLIVCFASFAGLASSLAHANALVVQAAVYRVTPIAMSYSVSAATAGLMAGPILLVPLAQVVGVSACVFWSLICMIGFGVWSAEMTASDDYIPFVISRLFGGLVGSIPQILGNGIIVNIFFLHERGRAFAIYSTFFLIGTQAGPTFCAFIIQHTEWPVEFWWVVALQAVLAILVFVFVEETSFDRSAAGRDARTAGAPQHWLRNRLDTFFPGTRVVAPITFRQFLRFVAAPFTIFLSPVTLLAGLFNFTNFGFSVMITTLISIFLQAPEPAGYGFAPQQVGAFSFASWLGVLLAQAHGWALNDRVPLRIAARRGGAWRPEYRLHTLWAPGLVAMPVGLGLFGAALQYHLHFMVLALGAFLVAFGAFAPVPVSINYLVETFRKNPQEVGTALNVWRLLFGLTIPFFVSAWEDAVGIGWVFGMAAFFSLAAFGLVVVLMWKGPALRRYSLATQDAADMEKPSRQVSITAPASDDEEEAEARRP